jgi:transcriptional regulator with XRE-family HTH domain
MPEKKHSMRRTFIREWREYRGLTQVQLAHRLEGVVGQSTLSRLENGVYAYTQETLEGIAAALDCEPADLIGRLPGAPSELTLLVNKLSPEAQRKAIDIIKVMTAA